MIRKFFQHLNAEKVSYILISGQATIIYGAATFSEDIDIWLNPVPRDWNKFLLIARKLHARIYKLTPPLKMDLILKGHGYHFQFPESSRSIWFLDVMGKVPRVNNFQTAFKNVIYQETDWGKLPVLGIRDLVEIKKTRRLSDYTVISNLVKIEYQRLHPRISSQDWEWILENSFEVFDLLYYLKRHPKARKIASTSSLKHLRYLLAGLKQEKEQEKYIRRASKQIMMEIEKLRLKDINYWKPIIAELKSLQKKNQLLPEGAIPPSEVS
jgi:hypothetical protein